MTNLDLFFVWSFDWWILFTTFGSIFGLLTFIELYFI